MKTFRLFAITFALAAVGACAQDRSSEASRSAGAVTTDATVKTEPMSGQGIVGNAAADTASGAPAQAPGAAQPNAPNGQTPAPPQPAATAMLIRTGTASVEVDSLETAIARVQKVAERLGGFVASSSMQGGREQSREASLELKIPSARWDEVLSALKPIGKVESVNVQAQDVGEEFVDVQARMANAKRLEDRLLQLLATRTGKLDEVVQVEHELANVREEIERYQGRLRYLSSRVALSTLTVTVHEPRPVVGDYPGSSVIGGAFVQAWRNFVGFLAGFIALLGFLVPLGLIVAAIVWLIRRSTRGRRARSAAAAAPVSERPHLES